MSFNPFPPSHILLTPLPALHLFPSFSSQHLLFHHTFLPLSPFYPFTPPLAILPFPFSQSTPSFPSTLLLPSIPPFSSTYLPRFNQFPRIVLNFNKSPCFPLFSFYPFFLSFHFLSPLIIYSFCSYSSLLLPFLLPYIVSQPFCTITIRQ